MSSPPWTKRNLTLVEEGNVVKSGSFGSVFKGKDENGRIFAIKQISVEAFLYKSVDLRQRHHTREPIVVLKREAKFLRSLDHENVIKYFDSWFEGPQSEYLEEQDSLEGLLEDDRDALAPQFSSGSTTISGNNFFYIKMEFGGDFTLKQWISRRPTQNQRDSELKSIHEIFFQLLKGMKYIHERNLVHRDLKPDNIFMNSLCGPFYSVKIGDFGLARYVNGTASVSKFTVAVGATLYRSPEVDNVDSNSNGKYDTKSDMYSLGLIFLETLCALDEGNSDDGRAEAVGTMKDLVKWRNGHQDEKFYNMMTKYPIHMELIKKMTFKETYTSRPAASEIITQIFNKAIDENVEYFEARPQWYTSFLTPPQFLTPSSGLAQLSDDFLNDSGNGGKRFWNPRKAAINRPTCVFIGLEEDLVKFKEYYLSQHKFFVEVVYLQKQTLLSATEDYKKSSFRFLFNEKEEFVRDDNRKSNSSKELAAIVLGKLAAAKRSLMGVSTRDGDYLQDYSVVHYMMKVFPVIVTIRKDTNDFKTTMEFEHFIKEHGKPPALSYWRVRSPSESKADSSVAANNISPLLHLRHLEFSNAPELLYHLRDNIGQFMELQNGFTLNETQRTRIQPTPGYEYDSSSYLDLKFYDERTFEKLGAKDQKGCSIS